MIRHPEPLPEVQYRPQAAKTLRQCLMTFISREFPRLGGPWVIELFVAKLLELIETYWVASDRLQPGQTVWQAVAIDERPAYRKSMADTRLVPVVVTLVNQEDITQLRGGADRRQVLKHALVRAAHDAYAQGGVLTVVDLGLLFHESYNEIARLIRRYEAETGETVPRRGNVHDMGRTVSHKAIICRKAYVDGKLTPVIARETFHSPAAVDRYLLDFARVHVAVVQCRMTPEEAAFAIQRPLSLVRQYIQLIDEFGLQSQQIHERVNIQLAMRDPVQQASPTGEVAQSNPPEPRTATGTNQSVPPFQENPVESPGRQIAV